MADESTTASTPTTEPTAPNPGTEASSTSTTQPTSEVKTEQPTGAEPTILTEKPAEEGKEPVKEDEGKGEGDQPKEGDDEKPAENAELFGAPEGAYELEGLPEGTTVDTKALEAIEPVARELGLSSKGLSKIAGVYAEKVLPQVVEGFSEELERNVVAQRAAWATEATELVKTDEIFGGRPLPEIQQVSAKALDRFGGADFRKFLDETGLGNHPAMLKFAYSAGSAISEDDTFERGNSAPKPKSRTEKYYGPQSA